MLHPDCVYWCVMCCYWVLVQSDDDFSPDVHQTEFCGRPPLLHCDIFYSVFMSLERW